MGTRPRGGSRLSSGLKKRLCLRMVAHQMTMVVMKSASEARSMNTQPLLK